LNALVTVLSHPDTPAAARVSAANAILDRGYGKATQPISGDDEMPPAFVETDTSKIALALLNLLRSEPGANVAD
jgi:hypothetical protein